MALMEYVRGILTHVPWEHWIVFAVVSSVWTVFLLLRKRFSVYGAISFGLTVFIALFILDTAVVIRYLGIMKHTSGYNLALDFSRMFQKTGQGPTESISNVAVFIPFGFFLAEYLASTKRFRCGLLFGFVALAAFGLSLCIEFLQVLLHVGFFELTDLVMNTVGGVIGASLALSIRVLFKKKPAIRKQQLSI